MTESFLLKMPSWAYNLTGKRAHYSCYSVNFVSFFETDFFAKHLRRTASAECCLKKLCNILTNKSPLPN